jgi:hypothetical protein
LKTDPTDIDQTVRTLSRSFRELSSNQNADSISSKGAADVHDEAKVLATGVRFLAFTLPISSSLEYNQPSDNSVLVFCANKLEWKDPTTASVSHYCNQLAEINRTQACSPCGHIKYLFC